MLTTEHTIILEAAEKFGTPLYFYDGQQIRQTLLDLRTLAHPNIDIYYSLKANPLIGICQLLQREQVACEVCSAAELEIAIHAGFKPDNIIFVGPGKSGYELKLCVDYQINAVVCESMTELTSLNAIAQQSNRVIQVLLRINPDFIAQQAPLKMGGKATQFGMDLDFIHTHAAQIFKLSHVQVIGIHIYNGTRILDEHTLITNTNNILMLADELSNRWGRSFTTIGIGGGFGIPYFPQEKKLDISLVFTGINYLITEYMQRFPATRFILESGRYLVGQSGCLISQVLANKSSHGEDFIITNGGMHCHMAATGMGSVLRRNFPIEHIVRDTKSRVREKAKPYTITGPLCTPGDVIATNIQLSHVNEDDLIVINNSGAYGATASPGRFLSHGFPAEVLYDDQQLQLLRRRETVEDILATQLY